MGKKLTYCEEYGHKYEVTTAPGWFRCERPSYTKKGTIIPCGAVALCPGCLGYRLAGAINVLCVIHYQTCVLEDFPLVVPVDESVQPAVTGEQLTFW